jgi:hypothetical protein
MPEVPLNAAGRPRSPGTLPGLHAGRSPRNTGRRPPTVAELVAVIRHAGTGLHAARLRALIVVLWRAYASTRPSRSARRTSIGGAARCSCVAARALAVVRSAWTTGLGSSFSYLQGIDGTEIIDTDGRRPPMVPVDAALHLRRRGAVRPRSEATGGALVIQGAASGATTPIISPMPTER